VGDGPRKLGPVVDAIKHKINHRYKNKKNDVETKVNGKRPGVGLVGGEESRGAHKRCFLFLFAAKTLFTPVCTFPNTFVFV